MDFRSPFTLSVVDYGPNFKEIWDDIKIHQGSKFGIKFRDLGLKALVQFLNYASYQELVISIDWILVMESLWFIVEYRRTYFIYHGMMLLILYRKFTTHICCSHICGLEFPQPPTTRNHLDTQHGRIKIEIMWPITAAHKWFLHSVSWLSNCMGHYSIDKLSIWASQYQIASWSLCTQAFSRWALNRRSALSRKRGRLSGFWSSNSSGSES